jgi:hypothetical protein
VRFRAARWDFELQGAIPSSKVRRLLLRPSLGLMVFDCHQRRVSTDIPSAVGGDDSFQGLSNGFLRSFPLRHFSPCQYFQSPERKEGLRKRRVSINCSTNYVNREICTKAKMISQAGTRAQYPTASKVPRRRRSRARAWADQPGSI